MKEQERGEFIPRGFIQVLDKYLSDNRGGQRKSDCFHVSDMGKCMRMRYWKRKGEEGLPFEPRVLRIFEIGSIVHERMQEILEELGILVAAEDTVSDGDLVGHMDSIVKLEDSLSLWEFKTVHSGKFSYLTKRGKPDRHYVRQLMTYTKLARKDYPDLKDSRLIYLSKDDLRIAEYGFSWSDEWDEKISREMSELRKYWEEDELPPADPPESWMCKYCMYRHKCFPGKYKQDD